LELVPYTVKVVPNLKKEGTGAPSCFNAKFNPHNKILYPFELSTSKPDVGEREQICSMLVYSILGPMQQLFSYGTSSLHCELLAKFYSNAKYCYALDLAMETLWMPL
jgi:hypothetical protein